MPAKYMLSLLGLIAVMVVLVAAATGCDKELLAKNAIWAKSGDLVNVFNSDGACELMDILCILEGAANTGPCYEDGCVEVAPSWPDDCDPCTQSCIDRTLVCDAANRG